MTLADQIREIDFGVPAPEVAKQLGCRPEYVRATRNRARHPDRARELGRKYSKQLFERDPDAARKKWREAFKRHRLKDPEGFRAKRRDQYNANIEERRQYHREYARARAAERRAQEAR